MDEAPRSRTYILNGTPQSLVVRRSDDTVGWSAHKHVKIVTNIELQSQHNEEPLFAGPLSLVAFFYFNEPCSARSRNKSRAGDMYILRPSLFCLIRFIESIAQGIIYTDDSIIANVYGQKLYDHTPRTEFTITEINGCKEKKVLKKGRS